MLLRVNRITLRRALVVRAQVVGRKRINRGLSQKQPARSIGADPETLSRWESWERAPAKRSQYCLREHFEMDDV